MSVRRMLASGLTVIVMVIAAHPWIPSNLRFPPWDSATVYGRRAIENGDVVSGINCLKGGLFVNPSDNYSREGLQLARRAVNPSNDADLRPESDWYPGILFSIGFRLFSYVAYVVMCVSLVRYFLTAKFKWLTAAFVLAPLAMLPLTNAFVDWSRANQCLKEPTGVVKFATELRQGNGNEYPTKRSVPAGAECRRVNVRGDWVQVQFANGLIGWIPHYDASFHEVWKY